MSEWFDGSPAELIDDADFFDLSPGSGTKTVSKTVSWDLEGYRYADLRLKTTDAAQTLVVRLQHSSGEDKSYTITSGLADTFSVLRIDLCKPDDVTDDDDSLDDDVYTQESRYPLIGGASTVPSKSDALWGFNVVETISITFPDGQTVTIDYINLVRDTFGRIDFIPAFEPFKTGWTSTTLKSALWTNADGRMADLYAQTLSGGVYGYQSITGQTSAIAGRLGWTTSSGGSLPADGYHTNSLEALILGGSGVVHDWSGGFQIWINKDVTSTTQIPAQMMWDEVVGYPEIGDAWTGGSYGGELKLRMGKVQRGNVRGLVFNADGSGPESGATVTLKTDPGGSDRGSGSPDVQGYYSTGSPFGQNDDHKAYCKDLVSPLFEVYNRFPHRRSWLAVFEAVGGISYCVSPDLKHYLAYTDSGGYIVTEAGDNAQTFVNMTQSFQGTKPHLAARKDGSCSVRLCYEDGGDLKTRISYDGLNWGAASTIATGDEMRSAQLQDRGEIFYWLDGTDIKGQVYDNAGNAIGSSFTAVSGVDSGETFDVHESSDGGSKWYVRIWCLISGVRTRKVSTDGVNFS